MLFVPHEVPFLVMSDQGYEWLEMAPSESQKLLSCLNKPVEVSNKFFLICQISLQLRKLYQDLKRNFSLFRPQADKFLGRGQRGGDPRTTRSRNVLTSLLQDCRHLAQVFFSSTAGRK